MPVPDEKRCQGTSRTTGKRCGLKAVPPSKYCQYHGAQALGHKGGGGAPKGTPQPPGAGGPPPKGSTNAMTYGAYTPKMPAHLEALREMYVERYTRAVEKPDPFDLDALERAAGLQAKFSFAIADSDCPASTLDTIHRLLHVELKALKATRASREQTSTGTSPAEVIAVILAKVAERKRQLEEGTALQAPLSTPQMFRSVRQGVVIDVDPPAAEQDIGDQAEEDLQEPAVETVEREEEGPAQDPDQDPELLEDEAAEEPADQVGSDDEWFPW